MSKLTVVTDDKGLVVGTQLGHGDIPDPATGIRAALAAGPGQVLHKIDVELPQLRSRADVEHFHEELRTNLARQAD
jgi:hypothetical protein